MRRWKSNERKTSRLDQFTPTSPETHSAVRGVKGMLKRRPSAPPRVRMRWAGGPELSVRCMEPSTSNTALNQEKTLHSRARLRSAVRRLAHLVRVPSERQGPYLGLEEQPWA